MINITNDLHDNLFRQFDSQLSRELGDQLRNQFDLRIYQTFDRSDVAFYWPLYNQLSRQLSSPLYSRLFNWLEHD